MNLMKRTLLAATLLACTAGAFASPDNEIQAPLQKGGPAMMLPPPPAPTYAVIQQTDSPNEALNTIVKNVPELEKGKKYEVRLEVKELPSPPQGPAQQK
ncbi:hypothetical protein [Klebsiella oxytoca]|uniref:hypothetical protein n=1 Tax=Klebsiella oxytoca TaxID=571 RepID=UPI003570B534|nr:hypothetical protein [Klebsiella oxytoca]HCB2157735.1 hypothetical protein [Klebsiella oxytoca]